MNFRLMAAHFPSITCRPVQELMNTAEQSRLRILLLEDSALDAELILRELKQGCLEFVSTRVQNGDDFERALAEFQPGLILADYKLPTFNGAQALVMARECSPDVPLIIISGAVGEETAVELLKNGATDFVLKDRIHGRLVPTVERALREVAERRARRQAEADLRALNEQLEQRVTDRPRGVEAITARRVPGPALGLIDDVAYLSHELPIAAGDRILAFTDGLFEAENANSEPFSIARLRESIYNRADLPLAELLQDVFDEVEHFAEGEKFSDDVCLIGMEISRLAASAA
jgi:CheY-like chemotaxis protein